MKYAPSGITWYQIVIKNFQNPQLIPPKTHQSNKFEKNGFRMKK